MDKIKAAEELALQFHQAYERLAPSFGYETRPDTKVFDPESNNGKLMIAVCSEMLSALSTQSPKWVKASERRPGGNTKHICRDSDNPSIVKHLYWNEIPVYYEWLDESPSSTHPLQEKIDGLRKLFDYLAQYGGKIFCSNELSSEWINQARASGRMYVDDNSIGYIWEPDIKKFPETEEEVLFLEKWYPLDFELPESLKTLDWLFKDKKDNDSRK